METSSPAAAPFFFIKAIRESWVPCAASTEPKAAPARATAVANVFNFIGPVSAYQAVNTGALRKIHQNAAMFAAFAAAMKSQGGDSPKKSSSVPLREPD
jgi:hypothetical protein